MAGGTVVRTLDPGSGRRLREELERQGFRFREEAYTAFSAAGPGVNVKLYETGKLVVQGKGAEDFVSAWVDDPDELCDQTRLPEQDRVTEPIIGTDESGKGDYFGPLVVAAILVEPKDVATLRLLGVRDSKLVRDGEAMEIARQLHDAYGERIGIVCPSVPKYNELHRKFRSNLNNLLAWGHATAVKDVLSRNAACVRVISDRFGNERLILDALEQAGLEVRLEQRPRAESHPAVAAASILARARFLAELRRLGEQVGTKLPKGAGTPVDVAARELLRQGGIELLGRVAKLHFRTTQKIQGLL